MELFLKFLIVFAVGGGVCLIAQVLINFTKLTTARILVIFLLVGVVLEAASVFEPIKNVVSSGITVPIIGFGAVLARGAIEGAKNGLLQSMIGGLAAASAGVTAAIIFSFLLAMIAKPRSKKL